MNKLNKRTYKLWAYTVSHSFLILRSPLRLPDQDNYDIAYDYNIDIEFVGVEYLDIPNILEGIIINELEREFPKKFEKYKDLGFKIFEILSQNNKYYIIAGSYRIGKSKWISENRIFNMNLEYDETIENSFFG